MASADSASTTPELSDAMLSASSRVTVAGHQVDVFVESPPLLDALAADLRTATRTIWLETYIFLDDAAGQRIAAILRERAAAGVEVRVLYDAIGCQSTPGSFFRALADAGVHVHCFHSLWEGLWRFRPLRVLNRRNHRKLIVIDGRVAYFGGMNITDPASDAAVTRAEQLPISAGWRDVHFRMVGPQVRDLDASFERSWRSSHGERIPRRPRRLRRLNLNRPEAEWIEFFDTGPGRSRSRAAAIFRRLLTAARQSIWVSMAYFLPVGGVLRAFLAAARRGVTTRIITPGESDVPIVQFATRHLHDRLLRRNIRLYERQGRMLHSKVLVVDDEWSLVGSSNLDPRSLNINLEFIAVVRSREFASALVEIARYEMNHSERITRRTARQRGWWERLKNRLAWAVRWWL